jgi:hypothetical protein
MPDYVVIDHHFDELAEVYRLTVGIPVTTLVADPDDLAAPPVETVVDYDDVHDYVFAAADERWKTSTGGQRKPEHVAAEQRDEVATALRGRPQRGPRDTPAPVALPGIGESIGG